MSDDLTLLHCLTGAGERLYGLRSAPVTRPTSWHVTCGETGSRIGVVSDLTGFLWRMRLSAVLDVEGAHADEVRSACDRAISGDWTGPS